MKPKWILGCVLIYAVFEVLALFSEGKIYHFKDCASWFTALLYIVLFGFFGVFMKALHHVYKKLYSNF